MKLSPTPTPIVNSVRKLVKPDGTPIKGPMSFYKALWIQLTDDDAKALAAYVRALPAVRNRVPAR